MPTPEDEGCWAFRGERRFDGRPALFLDRDGVVVEEVGYLRRVQDVRLVPDAGSTIAAFNRAGAPVILVTNQSGVARGFFGWPEFEAVQDEIGRLLGAHGAKFDAVFACGCHEEGRGRLAIVDHPWRKPNPGMFLAAAEALGIELSRSAIVGDRAQDLKAGRAAGLPIGLHVATGHGTPVEQAASQALAGSTFDVILADQIGGARVLLERLTA